MESRQNGLALRPDLAQMREAVADYNKAVAQLRFAEGTLLEHHRIQLDIR